MGAADQIADSKWIKGLDLTMPMRRAALRVLRARLQLVQSYFPLAADRAHEDVEHVHQLRVATRRARAALELFRTTIAEKTYDDLRRHLRRIRRSAGAARDADVMLERLFLHLRAVKGAERPGLHALAGQLAYVRHEAQEELRQTHEARARDFDRAVRSCLRDLRSPTTGLASAQRVGAVAGPHLLALLDTLETLAVGEQHTYESLHQVRIVGKQLRYALEIFADCFDAALREQVYPRVEALQDVLGELNDARMARAMLVDLVDELRRMQAAFYKEWRKGLEAYVKVHEQRVERGMQAFQEAWDDWQKAGVRSQMQALVRPGVEGNVTDNGAQLSALMPSS